MTCLICQTSGHRGTTGGNGPDPEEPCLCGQLVTKADAREMGEYAFLKACLAWEIEQKERRETVEAEAS